ncbi:helix-turn-helix domain-containing protein [Labilibaculum sp.]|uniref:helix-turn-helix domain-containing protein n=1 Tax=Labilibaculum sp. TaxID=2060723 RepID=UPI003563D809
MTTTKIQKQCAICGKSFTPKTVNSIHCSRNCTNIAYRKRKAQLKKKEQLEAIANKIPDNRKYLSVREAINLFGVTKSTLYRHIRQGTIPAINLGTRLIRIDRSILEKMFSFRKDTFEENKSPTVKLYRLEPEDCYTIGEISKKFGISDSSVYKHIRKFSIPIRQIGKYVYAPKSEIDNIYKGKKNSSS